MGRQMNGAAIAQAEQMLRERQTPGQDRTWRVPSAPSTDGLRSPPRNQVVMKDRRMERRSADRAATCRRQRRRDTRARPAYSTRGTRNRHRSIGSIDRDVRGHRGGPGHSRPWSSTLGPMTRPPGVVRLIAYTYIAAQAVTIAAIILDARYAPGFPNVHVEHGLAGIMLTGSHRSASSRSRRADALRGQQLIAQTGPRNRRAPGSHLSDTSARRPLGDAADWSA